MQINLPDRAKIKGANLGSTYKAQQLHLHWGKNGGPGSEHTIDGEKYPMEVLRPVQNENNDYKHNFKEKILMSLHARHDMILFIISAQYSLFKCSNILSILNK